ncbi:MAG: M48 family metallopeptidase, partial [Rhizobacter sp.]
MESIVLSGLFAVALVASLGVKFWLATRQMRHVARHRGAVPAPFAGTVSLAAHQKAADYTIAKGRLGLLTTAFGAAVLLGWTLLGGLDALNTVVHDAVFPRFGGLAYQLALLAAFSVISGLLDLPFDLYGTFRLEQRFGFNRMTWRLWFADAAKGLLVSLVIGLPIAALILWIMGATGPLWWLWAWGTWMGFNLLALVLYPTVIAPLFNKFEPLADESLQSRVQALMARCGFQAKGLFVMDGSRRSAHANAYFTGMGAAKRVVFFDTLLAKLTGGEVEAVLAHELGHFKHRHVVKRIVLMFALSLAGFALLGWLAAQAWFYTGRGVQPNVGAPNDALALLLFVLAVPPFAYFLAPVGATLSRKHEFE